MKSFLKYAMTTFESNTNLVGLKSLMRGSNICSGGGKLVPKVVLLKVQGTRKGKSP